jgi:hypothetical protein
MTVGRVFLRFRAHFDGTLMRWAQRALPYVAFASLVFGLKLLVINHFGNATPFLDQWDAEADHLYRPWIEGTLRWHDLFVPHNEHRIFTTRIAALLLFELNGQVWDPLLQMVVNACLHVLALLVLVHFLRQSFTDGTEVLFFSFASIVFSIPYAWENTLTGFQSQFYFLLLFSFMFLWCIVQYELSGKVRFLVGTVSCAVLSFFSLASGALTIAAGLGVLGAQWMRGIQRNKTIMALMLLLLILFMMAVALTPTISGHAVLKAKSFLGYVDAVLQALSWPSKPVFGIFIYMPMLIFMVWQLFHRSASRHTTWFVFAMCLWVISQILSMSYGRAVGILSSRYLDVFSVGLITNFVCILILKNTCKSWENFAKYFFIFWLLFVMHGFSKIIPDIMSDLQSKRYIGGEQEKHVKAYLASGDFSHLENKPSLHTPYPNAQRLKTLLDNKIIKAFLPGNLAQPLAPLHVEVSGLVLDTAGYYPTTPTLQMGKTYGTYNSQGDISQGVIRLDFDNKTSSRVYGFLISGYPTQPGMGLYVRDNLGHTYRIHPDHDPKEAWENFYLPISKGVFSVFLEDRSPSSWVAISSPMPEGRMVAQRQLMLLSSGYFLTLGVALLLIMLGGVGVCLYEVPRQ